MNSCFTRNIGRVYPIFTYLFSITFIIALTGNVHVQGQVVINEIMSSNGSTIADEDGDYEDWIELYNAGTDTVSLHMHGLSDNTDQPFRWMFPDTAIAPNQFMLVWASGKDRRVAGRELHSSFRISASGDVIILTSPIGERLDEVPPTEIPRDISFGRYPDGDESWFFFPDASPLQPNSSSGYLGFLPEVGYSVPGGFYNETVSLSFTTASRGVDIRYTLDGSEPDENSPVYLAPLLITDRSGQPNVLSTIRTTISENTENADFWSEPDSAIFKGTVVRARKMRPGYMPGKISTNTYFIGQDIQSRYQIPVISISADSVHFFGNETGIYVPGDNFDGTDYNTTNFRQDGDEWERPVHIELFENSNRVYATNAGVRMHGGYSRRQALKSLRLYFRSRYGDSRFDYPVFPDQPYTQYNRLILRNSGNDFFHGMYKDGFIQTLVGHLNFDTQAYRPSVVFLNGEYWGIHNIRERYDRHYLERVYQVDPDRIDLLTSNAIVKEGSNSHYLSMISYINNNDLADPLHYQQVSAMMDIENFIDYMIANIYIRNTDWPNNNIDFWRYQADSTSSVLSPGYDGRWRWLMYDTDFGFGSWEPEEDVYIHNTLEHATATGSSSTSWSTFLLRKLLENDTFRTNFINRFSDLMNTTFRPGHVHDHLDSISSHIEPYMPEHIHRYGKPGSMSIWHDFNARMKRFASIRPDFQREHIIAKFDLEGSSDLILNVNDSNMGMIRINSVDISANDTGIPEDPYPWTGTYFKGVPVTIKAVPAPGYRFVQWQETGGGNPEITIHPDEDLELTAIFDEIDEADLFPVPHRLQDAPFSFAHWPTDAGLGSFPDHMAFFYMNDDHPGLDSDPAGITAGAYDLNSGTRINGLADGGLSLINAGSGEENDGYPTYRLGAVVLGLNTLNMDNLQVRFTGGTLQPNSRIYHIRLQYRISPEGPLTDVLGSSGEPVEYRRNSMAGHSRTIGPVTLPETLNNRPYVQLWWRYYYTGEQVDEQNDTAAQLRLDNIRVEGQTLTSIETERGLPAEYILHQNYPNPFNPVTTIRFELPVPAPVRVTVYNMAGQIVAEPVKGRYTAGTHQIDFDASRLASGMYMYRFVSPDFTQTKKMMLLK